MKTMATSLDPTAKTAIFGDERKPDEPFTPSIPELPFGNHPGPRILKACGRN